MLGIRRFSSNTITAIYGSAFWNCQNLQFINLPEGLTYISVNAFSVCPKLQDITFPDSLQSIGTETIIYQWYENGKLIKGATETSYTVPTGKKVGEYTYYCKITSDNYEVTVEDGVFTFSSLNCS